MSDTPRSGRRLSWASALVLVVLILALLGGFIFYRLETWPARAASRVRDVFGEIAHFQPQISIHDRVFFEQTTPTLELAVVSREMQVEREIQQKWLGSTRRLRLRGVYRVRAGFDLRQPFQVQIEGRRISLALPPPRILGVDQISVEVLHFENGLWNRFDPGEVVGEVDSLPLLAREKASAAGLQKEALESFSRELREKLAPQYEVEMQAASGGMQPPAQAVGAPHSLDFPVAPER